MCFFSPRCGVCRAHPQGQDVRWWQVALDDAFVSRPDNVSILPSPAGLCLAEAGRSRLLVKRGLAEGHAWVPVGEDLWSGVSCEGMYGAHGGLCCLSPEGQLFIVNPQTYTSVPL